MFFCTIRLYLHPIGLNLIKPNILVDWAIGRNDFRLLSERDIDYCKKQNAETN
jgi:hypothetical protein